MKVVIRSREELVAIIVERSKRGDGRRAIARSLGVSRNTVRTVLESHEEAREEASSALVAPPTRAPRASKLDGFRPRVAALLDRFPDITAQRVFEITSGEGFTGGYTAVKKLVRAMRPPPRPTPSLVTIDYGPGEMSESDWSPYEVRFTSGKAMTVEALSYVLVVSKRKAFGLYDSNDLHALMDGLERAFARFGGCARECKFDSQKPVVLRWEGQQPIYNPRFLAFSSHYEFRPLAVRRGHPNDKPRTERSFWEVERSNASPKSSRISCRFRAIRTTRRASSIACAASTDSSRGRAITTRSRTNTSPTSSRSASRSTSGSSTRPTFDASRGTSSRRAAQAASSTPMACIPDRNARVS